MNDKKWKINTEKCPMSTELQDKLTNLQKKT